MHHRREEDKLRQKGKMKKKAMERGDRYQAIDVVALYGILDQQQSPKEGQ
jgi:hypothetical protein